MPDSNRGRPEAVTADDLFWYLQTSEEPCTVNDFADTFDVSTNTVRKRLDELERYEGVNKKKAANATVYWYSSRQAAEDRQVSGEDLIEAPALDVEPEDVQREQRQEWARARGVWLMRRDRCVSYRPRSADPDSLQNHVYYRLNAWTALVDYANGMADLLEAVTSAVDDDSEHDRAPDLDQWGIDERALDYYASQVTLFGEVAGLAELTDFLVSRSGQISDEVHKPDDEVSWERLDELLPGFEETLHAGDVFDDYVCEMLGYGW